MNKIVVYTYNEILLLRNKKTQFIDTCNNKYDYQNNVEGKNLDQKIHCIILLVLNIL